jgi:uncharacterized membrane protein YeiH
MIDLQQLALVLADFAAVFVFAATGALAAARRGHDIVTFGFFAAVTGVGGGTLRDVLLSAPVFWIDRPAYILVSLTAALVIWIFGAGRFRLALLLWLDALGMAAYAVFGAAKALSYDVPAFTAVVMGVLTATFGGVLRDVLAGEPSVLLRREIYVTAALLGATVFVLCTLVMSVWAAAAVGFVAGFGLRSAALARGWSLPPFAGRAEGDQDPSG